MTDGAMWSGMKILNRRRDGLIQGLFSDEGIPGTADQVSGRQ